MKFRPCPAVPNCISEKYAGDKNNCEYHHSNEIGIYLHHAYPQTTALIASPCMSSHSLAVPGTLQPLDPGHRCPGPSPKNAGPILYVPGLQITTLPARSLPDKATPLSDDLRRQRA